MSLHSVSSAALGGGVHLRARASAATPAGAQGCVARRLHSAPWELSRQRRPRAPPSAVQVGSSGSSGSSSSSSPSAKAPETSSAPAGSAASFSSSSSAHGSAMAPRRRRGHDAFRVQRGFQATQSGAWKERNELAPRRKWTARGLLGWDSIGPYTTGAQARDDGLMDAIATRASALRRVQNTPHGRARASSAGSTRPRPPRRLSTAASHALPCHVRAGRAGAARCASARHHAARRRLRRWPLRRRRPGRARRGARAGRCLRRAGEAGVGARPAPRLPRSDKVLSWLDCVARACCAPAGPRRCVHRPPRAW